MSRAKDEPGFASRWSRLKREADEPSAELEAEPEADAEALDDRTDSEVLEELGLPDPETLKSGDDFTAFMAKAVPARLRNRALRKLWISDPVFANLDMLIDYGDDFTDAATVIENLQTAYQVGKGFVDRVADLPGDEEEIAAGEKAEDQAEEQTEDRADDAVAEADDVAGAEEAGAFGERRGEFGAKSAIGPVSELSRERADPELKMPARQRMRFRVAEE